LPGVDKLLRGAGAECAVRTYPVVVPPPVLELLACVSHGELYLDVQTLSRSRPVNESTYPFSVGRHAG
jgi:hypothetical protein